MNTQILSRRAFLRKTSLITLVSVVPSFVTGIRANQTPNNKLNIGCIGIAGRGADNISELASENIMALCDVDDQHAAATYARFPNAKRFKDFRQMLDELGKQLDAIVVSTPDHTHAVAAMAAIKAGKHVYCEKPLAHSIFEVRELVKASKKYNVVTQLGNQGHSYNSIRAFKEWIEDGVIGEVKEVHAMCSSVYGHAELIDEAHKPMPVPQGLDWDLWLGPVQFKPYNKVYVPGKWRGWSAFGTGVIGDWTCHVIDPVFWALELDAPVKILAESNDYDPIKHAETFPKASKIYFEFPAKGNRPKISLYWYDGSARPERPPELDSSQQLPNIGALVIGSDGKILYGSHGAGGLTVLPRSRMKTLSQNPKRIPSSPGHHKEWVQACKDRKLTTGSNFSYGGPLTEIALLGIIALRFKGQELHWDPEGMRFTNCDQANQFIKPIYRQGWQL